MYIPRMIEKLLPGILPPFEYPDELKRMIVQ